MWKIEANPERGEGQTHRIVTDGRIVARIYGGIREADGVTILRALNNHDRLVAALQRIINHDSDTCQGIHLRDCIDHMKEVARAALAAAQE